MRLLDVNIAVAAHRTDHVHHARVRAWFDGDRPFCVPSIVQAGFVRLVTSPKVFVDPTSPDEAFDVLRALARQPGCARLEPGPRHLDLFQQAHAEAGGTPGLVTDAYLAALAIEHGATVVSLDTDFARFDGLRWERP